ncbi:transcription factor Adf-1-like [Zootermopsis nevadensis]|uniref:transcription factor Adf-1-like n=1 Tax=Zootermopsis nevadensis TaxID=136037 RepID=UPI000B8E9048|nr:transcription factor Adf-1-like [Zootermopsis nevadensis]
MAEIKFTGDQDEQLVKIVAENRLLFDPEVESYKDGNIRDNVWKAIAGKLNKSDGDCKKRWKYIRDSYNRFKRKRNMSTGSASPPKNSKWDFFKRLQFLELVSTERPTASNVDSDSAVPSTSNSPANMDMQEATSVTSGMSNPSTSEV